MVDGDALVEFAIADASRSAEQGSDRGDTALVSTATPLSAPCHVGRAGPARPGHEPDHGLAVETEGAAGEEEEADSPRYASSARHAVISSAHGSLLTLEGQVHENQVDGWHEHYHYRLDEAGSLASGGKHLVGNPDVGNDHDCEADQPRHQDIALLGFFHDTTLFKQELRLLYRFRSRGGWPSHDVHRPLRRSLACSGRASPGLPGPPPRPVSRSRQRLNAGRCRPCDARWSRRITVEAARSLICRSSRSYMASLSISDCTATRQASTSEGDAVTRSGHVSGGGSTPKRANRASSALTCRSSASTMLANGRTGPKASITIRYVARALYSSSSASRNASMVFVSGGMDHRAVTGFW